MTTDRFHTFLETRRGDLRKIATRTRGEMSIDDLASESWLIAIEIGQRRGWTFDFGDEDDQDTLFAWMHNRFVKYAEKAIRHAIKLDRDWDNQDGEHAGATLARLLTAPLQSDPQAAQQAHEEQRVGCRRSAQLFGGVRLRVAADPGGLAHRGSCRAAVDWRQRFAAKTEKGRFAHASPAVTVRWRRRGGFGFHAPTEGGAK